MTGHQSYCCCLLPGAHDDATSPKYFDNPWMASWDLFPAPCAYAQNRAGIVCCCNCCLHAGYMRREYGAFAHTLRLTMCVEKQLQWLLLLLLLLQYPQKRRIVRAHPLSSTFKLVLRSRLCCLFLATKLLLLTDFPAPCAYAQNRAGIVCCCNCCLHAGHMRREYGAFAHTLRLTMRVEK